MTDQPDKDGFWPLAEGARPCVGCGHCCRTGPCWALWRVAVPRQDSWKGCPQLRWTGGRYECGLILDAGTDEERRSLRESLYIGAGCCSPLARPRKVAR